MTTENIYGQAPALPPVAKAYRTHANGLTAETEWQLPEYFTQFSAVQGKPLVLRLGTHRSLRGKLSTSLGACTVDGDSTVHRITHDAWSVLDATTVRVTEKALLAQHNKWLVEIQTNWVRELDLLAAHYVKQAASSGRIVATPSGTTVTK